MIWTSPVVTRIDEPFVADERTMLEGWLGWHRTTLLFKCEGLTGEQLARQAVPPSNLSLLGLIRHMQDVERQWFRNRFAGQDVLLTYMVDGNWNPCFDEVDPTNAEAEYNALVAEWSACDEAAAGASLDETYTHHRYGEMSLRWIYQHLIEEYARHNGHADLIRECIDGRTGD